MEYAWRRAVSGWGVQLCFVGAACAGGSSAARGADARLYKKSYGTESKLSYLGHALVENRNGLIAAAMVTHAEGYAERDAALIMLDAQQKGGTRRITVGADRAYDSADSYDYQG